MMAKRHAVDLPLRDASRDVLKDLDPIYVVRDGLLVISSPDHADDFRLSRFFSRMTTRPLYRYKSGKTPVPEHVELMLEEERKAREANPAS